MGLHNNGSNESQGRVVKLHHRQIDIQIPHPSKGREAMATSAKGVGSLPRREKQGRWFPPKEGEARAHQVRAHSGYATCSA